MSRRMPEFQSSRFRRSLLSGMMIAAVVTFTAPIAKSAGASSNADFLVVGGNGNTSPAASSQGSSSTSTGMSNPLGGSSDVDGNIVVADTGNNTIEVEATNSLHPNYVLGTASTWTVGNTYVIAGGGSQILDESVNLPARMINLAFPNGVAIDLEGNVVIADSGNAEVDVLAVSSSNPGYSIGSTLSWVQGNVYLIAGGGSNSPSSSSQKSSFSVSFSSPEAVAIDPAGNVEIADTGEGVIDLLEEQTSKSGYELPAGAAWTPGDVLVIAGSGSTNPSSTAVISGLSAKLTHPNSVAVDESGNLLIDNYGRHDIEVLAVASTNPGYALPQGTHWTIGTVFVVVGGGSNTPTPTSSYVATQSAVVQPRGISTDSSGDVVFADMATQQIEVLALDSAIPQYALGTSVLWSIGNLYVIAGGGGNAPSTTSSNAFSVSLSSPSGVIALPDGAIDVVDAGRNEIDQLLLTPMFSSDLQGSTSNGTFTLSWSSPTLTGGSAITDYRYNEYQAGQSSSVPIGTTDFSSIATSHLIPGLNPGTSYLLTLQALNAIGWGPESNAISVNIPIASPGSGAGSSGTDSGTSSGSATTDVSTSGTAAPPTPTTIPQPVVVAGVSIGTTASAVSTIAASRVTLSKVVALLPVKVVSIHMACVKAPCHGGLNMTVRHAVSVRHGKRITEVIETAVIASSKFALSTAGLHWVRMSLTKTGRTLVAEKAIKTLTVHITANGRVVLTKSLPIRHTT